MRIFKVDLKSKSFQDFERQAREWCELSSLDPDEMVVVPDPNGYAVIRRKPQWYGYAKELHKHWLMTNLVSR